MPVDCVASRDGREADSDVAIAQLEAAGAVITTAETVLLQLVSDRRDKHFNEVEALLKLPRGKGGDAKPDDNNDE